MCDDHGHDHDHEGVDRRSFLKTGAAAGVAAAAVAATASTASAHHDPNAYAPPAKGALPQTGFTLDRPRTALVVTDPQVDFLSPKGVTWGVVGKSVEHHGTVANIGRLFAAAKAAGMTTVISPHYYYPTDHGWSFGGPLEKLMHAIGMFDRASPYEVSGFDGSGADFMPEYKDHIHDGKTIICSPHKVYGPEANDLVLQLRKNHIDQVILAGMSRWSRTRPRPPCCPRATVISPRSSTSATSPTRCGRPTRRSSRSSARPKTKICAHGRPLKAARAA
jgi:nicotinamidase-related amidase